ncbi:type 1 periplasmic binding fold superfamily protein [Seonamhaeicola aphaedonensis]|uniref:Type 1 periplasmic binding fold superfamily protein n=1 Tax=Seonamhaeicola aphaedonensis TaxID=1461338 RepID=A0A3D9HA78_9FLAO|nr:type 1 periplasmic binding fold superfamily protein [Seonamhaeicola aphaedonensis]RED45866.1 hypothetical protein DFQ02_10711 [Seonamhaeicola aphaedonensis]
MKNLKIILILSMLIGSFISCDNDDTPTPIVEEEVITTMTITLSPVGGGSDVIMQTRDTDGDGPNPPVVTDPVNLTANTTYNGSIELLNELETPAVNITEEVEEEDEEHQFFFVSTNSIATFSYSDMDGNGNPIGLSFTLTTGAAGTGTVTVTLIHEPMKSASGVSSGDITNAGGEEDIAQTFNVVVQ